MSDIEAIKDKVWDAMESQRGDFDGGSLDRYTRGFQRFSDQIATLTALRIGSALEAYLADNTDLSDLGDLVRPALRTVRGQANTPVLDLLTAFDADGEPRFMLQVSKEAVEDRPSRRDREAGITEPTTFHDRIEVRVLETRKYASGLQGYPDELLSADVSFYKEYVLGNGEMLDGDYHRLAAFSAALFEALPHKADQLAGKTLGREISPLNADYKALIDFDGGLPGPATASMVDDYNAFTAYEVAKWAAPALRRVSEAQQEKGFVWGDKYLNFNDIDDSCFAVPTGVEGRNAVFHENISLINDYRSYIAWIDPSGEDVELSVRMIESSENSHDLVERFIAGEDIGRTMAVHLDPPKVTFARHYRDTDILSTLAFYLKVDHDLFVDGKLATRSDARVETDFSAFAPEFDDEDEDDERSVAKP